MTATGAEQKRVIFPTESTRTSQTPYLKGLPEIWTSAGGPQLLQQVCWPLLLGFLHWCRAAVPGEILTLASTLTTTERIVVSTVARCTGAVLFRGRKIESRETARRADGQDQRGPCTAEPCSCAKRSAATAVQRPRNQNKEVSLVPAAFGLPAVPESELLSPPTVSHGQSPTSGVSSTEPSRPQSFIERLPIAPDGMGQTIDRQTAPK